MSGGGSAVSRGAMRTVSSSSQSKPVSFSHLDVDVDAKQLQGWEEQFERCEQDIATLRHTRKELDTEIQTLTQQIDQADIQTQKLSMEIDAVTQQIQETVARLANMAMSCQMSSEEKRKVDHLKKEQAESERDLQAAQHNSEKLEKEVNKLQTAIMEAGGAKLKQQKATVERLNDDLDSISKQITKIQVDSESGAKQLGKCRHDIQKNEADKIDVTKKLEALQESCKQMEEDALQVMQVYKAAEAQLKAKSAQLEDIQNDFSQMKVDVDKMRSAELDIHGQMEAFNKIIKDNKAKAKQWSQRIKDEQKKFSEMRQLAEGAGMASEDPHSEAVSESNSAATENQLDSTGEQKEDHKVEAQEDPVLPSASDTLDFRILTPEELARLTASDLESQAAVLEAILSAMNPNMRAIADYQQKEKEYLERIEILDAITRDRDTARKVYDGLRKKRLDEFMAGFSQITLKLKEMYQMLTLGGDAELELVDTLDPFSEGIVFSVRPPKKSWKNIQNLSGGEKTLSSLALVFALHHYKPTPLYVMDEIDAALDFKNVSIVANYIKERTKNAQFIVISLRNNMFELADRLVGIYKTHDCTRSITIDPRLFVLPHEQAKPLESSGRNLPEPISV